LWPSIFASIASSLQLQLLLHPPIFTFVADPNVAAFAFFAIVAIVIQYCGARPKPDHHGAGSHPLVLYAFSRKLAAVARSTTWLWATVIRWPSC
jgi:K+-sensing histidine kinase KdpD